MKMHHFLSLSPPPPPSFGEGYKELPHPSCLFFLSPLFAHPPFSLANWPPPPPPLPPE